MISKAEADVEQTGSIARPADDGAMRASRRRRSCRRPISLMRGPLPPTCSRAAARTRSIPWENPNTGAGGNITPLAGAYSEGAFTCRDFLASYVHGERKPGCRARPAGRERGRWEVKRLKPLKQG